MDCISQTQGKMAYMKNGLIVIFGHYFLQKTKISHLKGIQLNFTKILLQTNYWQLKYQKSDSFSYTGYFVDSYEYSYRRAEYEKKKYTGWNQMLNQEEQLYFIKDSYLITGITLSRTFDGKKQ